MKRTTLENDTLASNTLIARLVSSEDLANLPGNKLDVYIDGTIQYEAFVRVGALPMPADAKQGVFYVLPDSTVWFLDEAGNWETLHADSDKPDSIYKSSVDFTEGIGLEGTCDVSDIEDFDATSASTMIGNIFFYTVSGKIAVLEGINGDELTYRVLVSPSDGVNSWVVQVNSIPNASTLNTLDTLTIRWDNMNLIYDGQGNLVERTAFKNSIKLGENVYLQEAGGHPWAIGTMRSNNASELTLSIREDLRYSKNGIWIIRMNYSNWSSWNTGIDAVSFGASIVDDVIYCENGTQDMTMDAYDMIETAKLNQLVYCRDVTGQTRAVGLWIGPAGTDFRISPLAVFADTTNLRPRNCWLAVDETQVNLEQLIDEEGTPFSLNIPAANTLAFSSVIDGNSFHQSGPYVHSSGNLKANDMIIIGDSNGVPRYQSTFRQYISASNTIQVMLLYPFPRDFQGKIQLHISTTLDISGWAVDNYATIPYSSIVETDYYTANSHSTGSGLEKYAKPGEPLYIYSDGKAIYKAFVSEYDDTNNELRLFLTEEFVDEESLNFTKMFDFNWNIKGQGTSTSPTPTNIFTAGELQKQIGNTVHRAKRIEVDFNGYMVITNKGVPSSSTTDLKIATFNLKLGSDSNISYGTYNLTGHEIHPNAFIQNIIDINHVTPKYGYSTYSVTNTVFGTTQNLRLGDLGYFTWTGSGNAPARLPFNAKLVLDYDKTNHILNSHVDWLTWAHTHAWNGTSNLSCGDKLLDYDLNFYPVSLTNGAVANFDFTYQGTAIAKVYFD